MQDWVSTPQNVSDVVFRQASLVLMPMHLRHAACSTGASRVSLHSLSGQLTKSGRLPISTAGMAAGVYLRRLVAWCTPSDVHSKVQGSSGRGSVVGARMPPPQGPHMHGPHLHAAVPEWCAPSEGAMQSPLPGSRARLAVRGHVLREACGAACRADTLAGAPVRGGNDARAAGGGRLVGDISNSGRLGPPARRYSQQQ